MRIKNVSTISIKCFFDGKGSSMEVKFDIPEENRNLLLHIPNCTRVTDIIQSGTKLYRITELDRGEQSGTLIFHKEVVQRSHR